MESNSKAGKINMSETAHRLLMEQCPSAVSKDRGSVAIKGKGNMNCFFLKSVGEGVLMDSERSEKSDETLNSASSHRGGGKYG